MAAQLFCPLTQGICPGCQAASDVVQGGDMHYIAGELLSDIAYKTYTDWEKLGIYLGVDVGTMNTIRGDKINIAVARPKEMFDKWWQGADVKTRWGELYRALTEVHRQDLIKFTQDFITNYRLNLEKPDEKQLQTYFLKMAEQTSRDWEDIGIYLHLSSELLKRIKTGFTDGAQMHRSRDVLQAWCRGNSDPTIDKLKDALREMKRNDVVMHIDEAIAEHKKYCRQVVYQPVQEQDHSASQPYQAQSSTMPPPQPHTSPVAQPPTCGAPPDRPRIPGHILNTSNIDSLHQPGSQPSVPYNYGDNRQIGAIPVIHEGSGAYQVLSMNSPGSMPSGSASVEHIREGVGNLHVDDSISGASVNTMSRDNIVDAGGDLSLPSTLSAGHD